MSGEELAPGCPWERTWEEAVALDEVIAAVREHTAEAHPTA